MSRAHLSIRHLIQQLEDGRSEPSAGLPLPAWLTTFIEDVAEHFEPETESARAGYVCSCTDEGWCVTLFLGMVELVGGADDGALLPIGFRFDVDGVRHSFDHIHQIAWQALPSGCAANRSDVDEASLRIDGLLNDQQLQLLVRMRPPADIGPGLLRDTSGQCLPA